MVRKLDDEARNTKPVRIPSVPPPTGAHPVVPPGEGRDAAPGSEQRLSSSRDDR